MLWKSSKQWSMGLHQKLLLQGAQRLAGVEIAGAARQAGPPVIFDAGMEQRNPRRGHQGKGSQCGAIGTQPGGKGKCRQRQGDRSGIAPALPDAKLTRLQAAQILTRESDRQGGERAQQHDAGNGAQARRTRFDGHGWEP